MRLIILCLGMIFPTLLVAQSLPEPNQMYVVTNCFLNEGYSLNDAVNEGRESEFDGPLNIVFRQPIATPNAGEDQFVRIVAWENLQAWVNAEAARTDINVSVSYGCKDAQRRFFTSRQLGENTLELEGDATLTTITACTLKDGVSYSDAYLWLEERAAAREANGDTRASSMVLGVLGRTENSAGLGKLMGVRTVGSSSSDLAEALDSIWAVDGSAPDYAMTPAESCQNTVLYKSFFISSN